MTLPTNNTPPAAKERTLSGEMGGPMSKTTTKTAEDQTPFPRRLYELMAERDMSQSDLARACWGAKTDSRGYNVARNRDRISAYLSGKALPDTKNLRKLAKALGVDEAQLAGDRAGTAADRRQPEIAMTAIAGHEDHVHLRINKLVPLAVAAKVIQMISKGDG